MKKPALAILTIGIVPVSAMLPLLTEEMPPEQIHFFSLLDGLSNDEIIATYGLKEGEKPLFTLLADKTIVTLSHGKIEQALKQFISWLDSQDFDVILLMSTAHFTGLRAQQAILLEPDRIIPPLVASIVEGHRVGVMLPLSELLPTQQQKWAVLNQTPYYTIANPLHTSEAQMVQLGRDLLLQGADVLVLDCLGYYQKHRDYLQKELGVPVLLSNVLLARLTSELLVM